MKRPKSKRTSQILSELGASETINSGATLGDNDAVLKVKLGNSRYNGLSIEVKCTDKKSFSITRELLKKVSSESQNGWFMPALLVDLQEKDTVIIIRVDDFMDIITRLDYLENVVGKK